MPTTADILGLIQQEEQPPIVDPRILGLPQEGGDPFADPEIIESAQQLPQVDPFVQQIQQQLVQQPAPPSQELEAPPPEQPRTDHMARFKKLEDEFLEDSEKFLVAGGDPKDLKVHENIFKRKLGREQEKVWGKELTKKELDQVSTERNALLPVDQSIAVLKEMWAALPENYNTIHGDMLRLSNQGEEAIANAQLNDDERAVLEFIQLRGTTLADYLAAVSGKSVTEQEAKRSELNLFGGSNASKQRTGEALKNLGKQTTRKLDFLNKKRDTGRNITLGSEWREVNGPKRVAAEKEFIKSMQKAPPRTEVRKDVTSKAEALLNEFADSALFGGRAEAVAGLKTGFGLLGDYQKELASGEAAEEAQRKMLSRQHPTAQTIARTAGTLALPGLGAGIGAGRALAGGVKALLGSKLGAGLGAGGGLIAADELAKRFGLRQ